MAIDMRPFDRETVNLAAAGKILGISRPVMYELARQDALPVPVIKIGRRMVISRRALDALLNERKESTGDGRQVA